MKKAGADKEGWKPAECTDAERTTHFLYMRLFLLRAMVFMIYTHIGGLRGSCIVTLHSRIFRERVAE